MTATECIQRHKMEFFLCLLTLGILYSSIVPPMVLEWYHDENYSHGFIVPLIAGYFLYREVDTVKELEVSPTNLGFLVLFAGLLQLSLAWVATEYFSLRSSLVVVLIGLVLCFFGFQMLKATLLPILYLLFMVPLPYIVYDAVAFPLKLLVTKVSVAFLNAVGIVVMREGNVILFPSTTLEVADACSGMRSLVSLLALAVAYAFYIQRSALKRWIIVSSGVLIAVLTNILRVIVTGVLAQYWGARAAEGFFHEFTGLAVFALAMLMLVGVGVLLRGEKQEGPVQ